GAGADERLATGDIRMAQLKELREKLKTDEEALAKVIDAKGKDEPVAYPNTAYFLPIMYLFLGQKVEKLARQSEAVPSGSLDIRKEFKSSLAEDTRHAKDDGGRALSRFQIMIKHDVLGEL
ncbi:hypothetical protein LCGC14_2794290, partial [marine sediment metagenome]